MLSQKLTGLRNPLCHTGLVLLAVIGILEVKWRLNLLGREVPTTIDKARINNQITAPELRIIDEEGLNLGVMSLDKALALARERGVDLIEIVSTAKPPVARLMSFDKYRYQKEKAGKKERLALKAASVKHIQISPRAAKNDLENKARQLEKFLGENHPIEIRLRLRGREKYKKEWASGKLEEFLKMITVEHKVLSSAKFMDRSLNVQISKK